MDNFGTLERILQDTRYALRTMRKNSAFAAIAILMVALAIGGNTAMFTVIRAVLLKPLAYPNSDQLISVSGGATPTRFAEMQASAHSFTALAAFTEVIDVTLSTATEPEVLKGMRASAGFMALPGAEPLLGRSFLPQEDAAGGAPVAMISYELWQRRFGGDPQIVGKPVTLDATPYTIIGVLPPHFHFYYLGVDVYMTAPSEWPAVPPQSRKLSPYLSVFGRLKPGVSLQQANAELTVIHHQYATAHPTMLDAKARTPEEATALKDALVTNVRSMLWLLFGAVGFVLLIACANVASLLLARATFRSREFAVRAALGAARARLIGQLLVESVWLSSAGGALGALFAVWILRAITRMTSFHLPRTPEIQMDWTVLGFAGALSIATGIIFGLAPSLAASRPDLMDTLRASGEAAGKAVHTRIVGGLNVRGLLVVGQIGLSVVLLIGSALLVESIAKMRDVEFGFNPTDLLTLNVSLPPQRYDTDQKRISFFRELLERVEPLPGVRGVTAAQFLPMMNFVGTPVQDAGMPPLKLNERLIATKLTVMPEFFHNLQIPMRRGREFGEHDAAEAPRVAIIDERLACRLWPAYPKGIDPIGQRLLIGINPNPSEIVGVAADVHQTIEDRAWPESVYVPYPQNPVSSQVLAVRTTGDPLSFTGAVRQQVLSLDRNQPVSDIQTMDNLVEQQIGQRHLLMALLASYAGVAVVLALIGIYGLITYSVAQRTRELGIRRALGAQQSDILRLVIRDGLVLTLCGITLGLGGALALTRLMKALLFHVNASDPATFAGIAVLFLVVALTASYIPARRASKIDPMAALRA